jgi:hypothetical protein
MYYVETRADISGYTIHRVICLVIGSSRAVMHIHRAVKHIHHHHHRKLFYNTLVNRLGSSLSTSVLSFKLIALIVIEKF